VQLAQLKSSFNVNKYAFHDMSWRLDVEMARRNMRVMAEPRYKIRLDLSAPTTAVSSQAASTDATTTTTGNNDDSSSSSDGTPVAPAAQIASLHLQADYANMKKLETELQSALDTLNSAHCQRFVRYIT
jgi:COMM domain